jgi:acetyl-CoA acetyltransferase
MPSWPLKDKTCVVGVGNTRYGVFPETDDYGLASEALRIAVADAGIEYEDIDGLIINRIASYEKFAEMNRINPQYCLRTDEEGRLSAVCLMMAVQAVHSGLANTVALVYANNAKSAGIKYGGTDDVGMWAPWGFTSPGAVHAMMARRHMTQFGTKSEALGEIAVAIRHHASLNPNAVKRKPITVEEHQASRMICDPLHLLDYCLINDGGVALIVTSAEKAKDMKQKPVFIAGYACQDTFNHASMPTPDYWFPALQTVAANIYARSEIGRDAVKGLMIYDNFTPTVLFSLEGLGFCEQGQGGDFVADGALQLGRGRWPTNTSGGHLSESYMQGWGLLAESVRQCRGECGERQIPDCDVIQYICATNMAMSLLFRS